MRRTTCVSSAQIGYRFGCYAHSTHKQTTREMAYSTWMDACNILELGLAPFLEAGEEIAVGADLQLDPLSQLLAHQSVIEHLALVSSLVLDLADRLGHGGFKSREVTRFLVPDEQARRGWWWE